MPLDNRPVWLLDVDGVINCDRPGSPWQCAPYRATVHAGESFKLRWSPLLMRRIRVLAHSGTVEVRWCTTWCPWAHVLELAWCLPELARSLTEEQCGRSVGGISDAKTEAALAVAESGRPLIWTDDMVTPVDGPLHDRLTGHGRGLLIAPASRVGLTPDHMRQIEGFVDRHMPAAVLPA